MARGFAIASLLLLSMGAHASLLNYTFTGTMTAGALNLGGGAVPLAGTAFTIAGMTLSDIDVDPDPDIGRYPAMSTYTFDGVGSFITDGTTGQFYVQNCENAVSFDCIVLSGGPGDFSASPIFNLFAPIAADPNAGGVVLGGPLAGSTAGGIPGPPLLLTNSLGHTLFFLSTNQPGTLTVTAKAPEPSTLALFGLGLAGVGFARRGKRAAQH